MKILLALLFALPLALPAAQFKMSLKKADSLYLKRENEIQTRLAYDFYAKLSMERPDDGEILWRYSMACHFVGMRYEKDSDQKQMAFEKGKTAGLRAIEVSPNCAPCHFWTAINMALYAQEVGVFKMLFTLGTVEGHLHKAAEIDPTYAFGGAYRVLGMIQRNLPGILGGSDDKAVEYMEKAISMSPTSALNYLTLAEIYRDGFQDYQRAIEIAEKGSLIPVDSNDHLEERESKNDLPKLLTSLRELASNVNSG